MICPVSLPPDSDSILQPDTGAAPDFEAILALPCHLLCRCDDPVYLNTDSEAISSFIMAHTRQTYDYQAFAAVSRLLSSLQCRPVSTEPVPVKALKAVSRLLSLVSARKTHVSLCVAAARVLHSRDRGYRNRWDYFAATAAGPVSFLPACIALADRLSAFGLPVYQV